jgi:hypothetical protein
MGQDGIPGHLRFKGSYQEMKLPALAERLTCRRVLTTQPKAIKRVALKKMLQRTRG